MDNYWVSTSTCTSQPKSPKKLHISHSIASNKVMLCAFVKSSLTIILIYLSLESGLIIWDLRCCICNFKNYESLNNILWKFQKRHIALGQTMKNKVTSFVLGQKCHFWGLFYPQQADAWPTMHNTVTIFDSLIDLVIITKII